MEAIASPSVIRKAAAPSRNSPPCRSSARPCGRAHDHQSAARGAGLDRVGRSAKGGGDGAGSARVVVGQHLAPQVEDPRDERGGLLLLEGQGRGGEEEHVHLASVEAFEAMDGRRHALGDRVLIVPGDRALGAAFRGLAAADHGEGQARARDVGAVGSDSDHRDSDRAGCPGPHGRGRGKASSLRRGSWRSSRHARPECRTCSRRPRLSSGSSEPSPPR